MTTTYMIIEDGQPMDGTAYTFERLMSALPFASYDAEVIAFDMGELRRDLSTPLRIATEDVTAAWWADHHGAAEAMAWIEAGKEAPGLAQRFYADECGAYAGHVDNGHREAIQSRFRRQLNIGVPA